MISICIPTYSRLNYLKQAVASAQNQTYKNIEICVSQNPKEDGTDEEIKAWCEQLAAQNILRYNLNTKNLGLSGNLNMLIKFAKGDYVIFLGDDDLLAPGFTSSIVHKLYETNADIVFTSQFFINATGDVLQEDTIMLNHKYKRDILTEGIYKDAVQLVFDNCVPLSASVIKKSLFENYQFNEKLNTPELPFFLRASLNGNSFYYIKQQLAYYRLHKNSETSNGLTTDELLKDIIPISVPQQYQSLKTEFVSKNIIPAINKALLKGNFKLARFLLQSDYYPGKKITNFTQWLMSYFPLNFIRLLFKLRRAI